MLSTEGAGDGSMLETEAGHTSLQVVMTDSNCSLENLPGALMMENILHEIPGPTATQEFLAGEILVPGGQQETPVNDCSPLEELINDNATLEKQVAWLSPSKGNHPENEYAAGIVSVADMDMPSQIWGPVTAIDKDQEIQTHMLESFLIEPLTENVTPEEEDIAKHAMADVSSPMTEQQEYIPIIHQISAMDAVNTENEHLNAELSLDSAIEALRHQFECFATAEPSIEDNASCLEVVEETISAKLVMPLFGEYEHIAAFAGEPLCDNDISPKEESADEMILEAAIDAMTNELIMVTESSDEPSGAN